MNLNDQWFDYLIVFLNCGNFKTQPANKPEKDQDQGPPPAHVSSTCFSVWQWCKCCFCLVNGGNMVEFCWLGNPVDLWWLARVAPRHPLRPSLPSPVCVPGRSRFDRELGQVNIQSQKTRHVPWSIMAPVHECTIWINLIEPMEIVISYGILDWICLNDQNSQVIVYDPGPSITGMPWILPVAVSVGFCLLLNLASSSPGVEKKCTSTCSHLKWSKVLNYGNVVSCCITALSRTLHEMDFLTLAPCLTVSLILADIEDEKRPEDV